MTDTEEYRQLLLHKQAELLARVAAISQDKQQVVNPDFAEQAVELENEEVLNALDDEARHVLLQIKQALQRLEQGHYGLCARCGQPISPARLRAIPYTTRCIECAE